MSYDVLYVNLAHVTHGQFFMQEVIITQMNLNCHHRSHLLNDLRHYTTSNRLKFEDTPTKA